MYQYFTLIASISTLTEYREKDNSNNNRDFYHSKIGGNENEKNIRGHNR